jgi:hypothetical protein
LGKLFSRRDNDGAQLDQELVARKAIERAEQMSTSELITWVESISSTIAVQLGSYSATRGDDTALHEARRQTEVLHGLLTVLISRP